MNYRRFVLVLTLVFLLVMAASSAQVDPETLFPADEDVLASAALINTDGEMIGGVVIAEFEGDDMENLLGVWAIVWEGLEPGFHGFHIHSVGVCEHELESPFTSAGGHFNPHGTNHGAHVGDLPSLYVLESGGAALIFMTDAFTVEDLLDEDGSAFMIHAGSDNFANVPERYGTADDATLGTGDAGSRAACGVIESGMGSLAADE